MSRTQVVSTDGPYGNSLGRRKGDQSHPEVSSIPILEEANNFLSVAEHFAFFEASLEVHTGGSGWSRRPALVPRGDLNHPGEEESHKRKEVASMTRVWSPQVIGRETGVGVRASTPYIPVPGFHPCMLPIPSGTGWRRSPG
jgi:hypothetical protein